MKVLQCILGLIFLVILFNNTAKAQETGDWQDLFNGKDLSGWDIKITGHDVNDNYKNTFHVEDGILKIDYSQYETFDPHPGTKYGGDVQHGFRTCISGRVHCCVSI